VGTEVVAVSEGLDRILAVDLSARRTQPPRPISSMDGYAVRYTDVQTTPVQLRCVGSVAAGSNHLPAIPKGCCVRIFTGATMPPDADSVVIQENTDVSGDQITVAQPVDRIGQWVRSAGLDFSEGECLLPAGSLLRPADIGLAAAMNYPWLEVRQRPRVAVLSTGDEIALPGEPLGESRLPSSNSLQLMASIRRAGGEPVHLGVVPDDPEALRDRVMQATRTADLIVTSGGASVGDHDYVQRMVGDSSGGELHFWKIAMRPGKPLLFGSVNGTPLLGLPGNPVSCFVCGLVFMLPAIQRLSGWPVQQILDGRNANISQIKLGRDLAENDSRQDYLRAMVQTGHDGTLMVMPHDKQDSSMMSILSRSDCLIIRPPYAQAVASGSLVSILRF
jgi:molybdopterin molybdotransferase